MVVRRVISCVLLLGACSQTPESAAPAPRRAAGPAYETPADTDAPRFLKGQLHCHSDASGDSDTPVDEVSKWYADRDYDFIVLTDHNRITDATDLGDMLVLPGVELTQNTPVCEPPPQPGMQCLLHVNALIVDSAKATAAGQLPRPDTADRVDLYAHAVRVTEQLGGVSMLNHPNFHYAADARVVGLVARQGLHMLEVANMAVDSNNEGDHEHPNTELLWDDVLASGARVWATATDDAHHYGDAEAVRARGELAFVGDLGWVMVRAERSPEAIREALRTGDFYASNGVYLQDVRADGKVLEVELAERSPGEHTIRFIGSGGRQLARERGRRARFDLADAKTRYVRAVIEDDQGRKAWTQPLFVTEGGRT